jgi:hypothetical protein
MLFKSETGTDKSATIVIDMATTAKALKSNATNIYIDFKLDTNVYSIENHEGRICRASVMVDGEERYYRNSEGDLAPQPWENDEDLLIYLSKLNPQTTNVAKNGVNRQISVVGLCSTNYDPVTQAFFIKTNGLGVQHLSDPNLSLRNYMYYMLLYSKIKKDLTTSHQQNGKPNNYAKKEHELFLKGYMPLAIVSETNYPDITTIIHDAIDATPMREGKKTLGTYSVSGRPVQNHETIWVTKRSVDKFLKETRPGYYNTYGYKGINLKNALITLMDYAGYVETNSFCNEFEVSNPFKEMPIVKVPFAMSIVTLDDYTRDPSLVYDLEIKRMTADYSAMPNHTPTDESPSSEQPDDGDFADFDIDFDEE